MCAEVHAREARSVGLGVVQERAPPRRGVHLRDASDGRAISPYVSVVGPGHRTGWLEGRLVAVQADTYAVQGSQVERARELRSGSVPSRDRIAKRRYVCIPRPMHASSGAEASCLTFAFGATISDGWRTAEQWGTRGAHRRLPSISERCVGRMV